MCEVSLGTSVMVCSQDGRFRMRYHGETVEVFVKDATDQEYRCWLTVPLEIEKGGDASGSTAKQGDT